MIDKELFDSYSTALSTNADLAKVEIRGLAAQCEGMTRSEIAAYLKMAYPAIIDTYGLNAAVCTVEFYAEAREASNVKKPYTPEVYEPSDGELLVRDVDERLKGTKDLDKTLTNLSDKGVEHVMKWADETILQNAERDPAHPKWALVPHVGACGWCVMIGSRGFDYTTRQKVSNTRHPSCKCTPVVDFDTDNPRLDGYEPDALYDRYKQAEKEAKAHAEDEWWSMSAEEQAKYKRKGRSAHDVFIRSRLARAIGKQDN